jgi:hypothetical protein
MFLVMLSVSVSGQKSPGGRGRAVEDPAAMVVGARTVRVSEMCAAIATLPPPQAEGYSQHPNLAAQWYGPIVAFAAEAEREHLDGASPAGEMRGGADEERHEQKLAEELIQKLARDVQPSESQIASYYAAHPSEFERAKARHIVISYAGAFASRSSRTAADAKRKADAVRAELKHGADFAALARAESDDPYTKNKGGKLGEVSHQQLEPAIDRIVWSLAPGQTSAPFEGRFGYEIVQVEGHLKLPLEDVRQLVIGDIKAQLAKRRQEEIIAAAQITLSKTYRDLPLPCGSGDVTMRSGDQR